jgi:hypothetical protein
MVHRDLKNRQRFKYIQQVIRLRRQLEEKYFDYNGVSPASTDNPEKNISTTSRLQHRRLHTFRLRTCGLPRSGAHRRALAQTIDNARGLDINSPRSAEAHTQDLQFRRHQQHGDPNNARGLDNNFASDRDCDSTKITRLRHRRLRPRRPRRAR